MKKPSGRARPTGPRRGSNAAARGTAGRPDPEDFDVFVPAAPDAGGVDDVFVPLAPVFRPLDQSGRGQAMYPVYDTDNDPHRRGLSWDCPYGCPGRIYGFGDDLQVHVWDCPWWQREGKDATPFELPAHGGGAATAGSPPTHLPKRSV